MSCHKRLYLIGLFLIAAISSVPQTAFIYSAAIEYFRSRSLPVHSIPGFSRIPISHKSELIQAAFSQNRFVLLDNKLIDHKTRTLTLRTFDPESGTTARQLDVPATCEYVVASFEDRLWILPRDPNAQSYELIDGIAQKSDIPMFKNHVDQGTRFLIDGEPAYVSPDIKRLAVFTPRHERHDWIPTKPIDLPDLSCEWSYGDTIVHFRGDLPDFKLIRCGDQSHVFLSMNGYVLYRQGIEFNPNASSPDQRPGPLRVTWPRSVGSNEVGVSAGDDAQLVKWSLVCDRPAIVSEITMHSSRQLAKGALLIEGQPAVLIIEEAQPKESTGTIHRFDGTDWSPWETLSFPFAVRDFCTATRSDGQSSYIVVATPLGEAFVYFVDASGIHPLQSKLPHPSLKTQTELSILFSIFVGSSILCAIGVWLLMWRYAAPEYAFGQETVQLASLARRGLARMIDIGLIATSALILGGILTWGLDWPAFLEAINLRVAHPSIPIVRRAVELTAIWIAFSVFVFLLIQGITGRTPGKRWCGIKTVRSTLRPCGIARSLTREIIFYVDSCSLLCWTPGILSIALTPLRQRLGDLVADTIVIDASTRKQRPPE
ncbi:RDD family protein [Schlesneria paludicola]|uniref:RDD family protein n=1 Tax=Schlesneria paludicola TaxID=360056 RepID=UPI00029AA5A3|nr:RDD family protein [Schlesneria paludicola]